MPRLPSLLYTDPETGGRLYVCSRHVDRDALDAIGVTVVLSAATLPPFLEDEPDVEVLRCEFEDGPGIRPDDATERASTERVAALVSDGHGALVQCQGGINRGPYLAALVLMRLGLSASDAVALLLSRHSPDVFSNESLARALIGRSIRADERGWRRANRR